jgi:hypothetical protein
MAREMLHTAIRGGGSGWGGGTSGWGGGGRGTSGWGEGGDGGHWLLRGHTLQNNW